jgi:uracil DNA glycosylase
VIFCVDVLAGFAARNSILLGQFISYSTLCDLCCRWEEFTDAVIRVLSTKKDMVYLLWGNPAQLK